MYSIGPTIWNRLRSVSNTLLIIIVVNSSQQSTYALNKEGLRHMMQQKLFVRQDPAPSTSSFDFWWPYPLTTATSTAAETIFVDTIPTPLPQAISPLDSHLIFQTSQTFSDGKASDTYAPQSSDMSSSSTVDTSIVSNHTPSVFISITALPPLSSQRHGHAITAYHQPTNTLLYLPLIGVFGILLGALCGWWAYGYWRKRFSAICIPGPRYGAVTEDKFSPADTTDENQSRLTFQKEVIDCVLEAPERMDGASDSSYSHEKTSMNDSYISRPQRDYLGWSCSKLASLLRSPINTTPTHEKTALRTSNVEQITSSHEPDQISAILEETNVTPVWSVTATPCGDVLSPNAPTEFSSVATSDEDDEDYEDARKRRQGSIRRRLVDKFFLLSGSKFGTRSQILRSHKSRGKTPELEEGNLLSNDFIEVMNYPNTFASCSSMRVRQQNSSGHGRAISDFTLSQELPRTPPKTEPLGRVYQLKDPGCGNAVRPKLKGARTYSTPLRDHDSETVDRFTPIPIRRYRSTERHNFEMITQDSDDELICSPSRRNRSVLSLPASPPQISSPRLDQELFFGSRSRLAGSLESGLDSCASNMQPIAYPEAAKRQSTSPRQTRNKLISKRSPARDFAARNLAERIDKESPPHKYLHNSSTTSLTRKRLDERSCTPPGSGLISTKQRYETHSTALDQVDAIVADAWNYRQSCGIPLPSSPTMFGAQTNDELRNFTVSMSIEQAIERK